MSDYSLNKLIVVKAKGYYTMFDELHEFRCQYTTLYNWAAYLKLADKLHKHFDDVPARDFMRKYRADKAAEFLLAYPPKGDYDRREFDTVVSDAPFSYFVSLMDELMEKAGVNRHAREPKLEKLINDFVEGVSANCSDIFSWYMRDIVVEKYTKSTTWVFDN